ncbi:MAG: type 1 glutamine amidotransferase domain-containing protein [Pseudomonadota bacterium]
MREPPQHLLGGLTVAILAANGFEQAELTSPRDALQALGVETRLLSLAAGSIQGLRYEQAADSFDVDMALDKADPEAYDAVLLPGGRQNAERLRASPVAQAFVKAMDADGKPIGALCHGTSLLLAAGLVRGRRIAGPATLRDEVGGAGGQWVDEAIVVDGNWVSSRKPSDVAAFNEHLMQLLASRRKKTMVGTADDLPGAMGEDG